MAHLKTRYILLKSLPSSLPAKARSLEHYFSLPLPIPLAFAKMSQTKQPTTPALEAGQPIYPQSEQSKDRFAIAAWLDTANVPTFVVCVAASIGYVFLCNEVFPAIWASKSL